MKLNKEHRLELIATLDQLKDQLNTNKRLLNESKGKEVSYFEIKDFLIKSQIELVEKSLIENEVDY